MYREELLDQLKDLTALVKKSRKDMAFAVTIEISGLDKDFMKNSAEFYMAQKQKAMRVSQEEQDEGAI